MMKRIMTPRITAVALAASAILMAPAALAEAPHAPHANKLHGSVSIDLGRDARLTFETGRSGFLHPAHHRYRYDRRDRYDRYDTRADRRRAVRQCRRAIRSEGYARGFREIDFDGRRVRQVGPRGFVVRFDTEFEGRRREVERIVRCEVRRGRIVDLEGVPWPGRNRHHNRNRYRD